MNRKKGRAGAGYLIVIALMVLCPKPIHAQAMVRDEPALGVSEPGLGPAGIDGNPEEYTTRQMQPIGVGPGPTYPGGPDTPTSIVDLSRGRGAEISMERGKWRPIFYFTTRLAYNDNIFIRRDKEGDFVTTFEPGVIFALGDFRDAMPQLGSFQHEFAIPADDINASGRYLFLDYHPSIYLFAKNDAQDSVDESVNLLGSYSFPKLVLGFQAQYQQLSVEDQDVGGRIDRTFYMLDLNSLYFYSDKTSWEINFHAIDHEYEAPFESSAEFNNQDYFDYQYGPKTNLGAGVAFGYVDYRHSPDQTYEQVLLRANGSRLTKINYNVSGGIEYRQSSGEGNSVNGIFNASLSYRPLEDTTVSLVGSRSTEPSALENEDVIFTRFGATLQQRLYSRLFVTARAFYANADYQRVSNSSKLARTDNMEEFYLAFAADFTRYATLQLTYTFRNDSSTLRERTYTENVISLEARATY